MYNVNAHIPVIIYVTLLGRIHSICEVKRENVIMPLNIVRWFKELFVYTLHKRTTLLSKSKPYRREKYPIESGHQNNYCNSYSNNCEGHSWFYKELSHPNKKVCLIKKLFGGRNWEKDGTAGFGLKKITWRGAASDGDKMLCLDNLFQDLSNGSCLVYSFGIANDWTFEKSMAELGCKVRAFDPTIDVTDGNVLLGGDHAEIMFNKWALFAETRHDIQIGKTADVQGVTLQDALKRLGDDGKNISVLKLDVEGEELQSLPQMLTSNMFENIRQLHLEVHTQQVFLASHHQEQQGEDNFRVFMSTINYIRNIIKSPYRIIHYAPNLLMERMLSKGDKFYTCFDLVLYKTQA